MDITQNEARNLISPFIKCDEISYSEYKGIKNVFPQNIIINAKDSLSNIEEYTPSQFIYENIDLQQERFYKAPIGLVFMVNNVCLTDCVYCYADKSIHKNSLSFNRIKDIIKNAYDAGVVSLNIVGGEFFLYKKWQDLLEELIQYNYKPSLISTKVPLVEKEIDSIKPYNISIQISLDSLNDSHLMKILNVKNDYLAKIKNTILLLNQKDIPFQVATVVTQYNNSIDNLNEIHSFLNALKNIVRWEIRVGFKSLYSRKEFGDIKISRESICHIDNWVSDIKKSTNLNILWSSDNSKKYFKSEDGSRNFVGSKCSANSSHMVLLPDGKVTICEQLYWNPHFIIGDLSKQSIEEVWNSPRALELAYPKRTDFRDCSACKKCEIFEECYSYPNKCFADVLKGYGIENTDYPDPRCKKAPQFIYDLQHY